MLQQNSFRRLLFFALFHFSIISRTFGRKDFLKDINNENDDGETQISSGFCVLQPN
jgi:hypothetical protein